MIAFVPGKGRNGPAARRLSKVVVDLTAWQIGLGFVMVGAAALYLSATWEGPHGPSPWDSILREAGALLFVTATLSVVWDLRGRRQLTNEVLSAAGLSKAITDAGLTDLTTHYAEIDWNGLLNRATHVDLFFSYAATWRAYHDAALRRLVKCEGARLRVILPDHEDEGQVTQLAARFGASDNEIIQKIKDAEQAFAALFGESDERATVELRVTRAFPVFTYYRFDGRCIGVLYSQAGERWRSLPWNASTAALCTSSSATSSRRSGTRLPPDLWSSISSHERDGCQDWEQRSVSPDARWRPR
jgi:hypothetical protein